MRILVVMVALHPRARVLRVAGAGFCIAGDGFVLLYCRCADWHRFGLFSRLFVVDGPKMCASLLFLLSFVVAHHGVEEVEGDDEKIVEGSPH